MGRFCTQCGQPAGESAAFCRGCGAPLPAPEGVAPTNAPTSMAAAGTRRSRKGLTLGVLALVLAVAAAAVAVIVFASGGVEGSYALAERGERHDIGTHSLLLEDGVCTMTVRYEGTEQSLAACAGTRHTGTYKVDGNRITLVFDRLVVFDTETTERWAENYPGYSTTGKVEGDRLVFASEGGAVWTKE